MKAVILAGGKGTRLGELTAEIPKPMVPVAGKPLLEHQIDLLIRYGFEEAILIVNHLKDTILEHFGEGDYKGIKISYFEEPFPMGTVGGIKEIEEQLQDDFLVLYGDVMMDMDLNRLIEFHNRNKSEATLVVHPNDHPYDSDLLEMDEGDKVTAFHPKPHKEGMYYTNMVNAAVYVFSPRVLDFLEKGKKADFGKHVFPKLYKEIDMYAYNTPEYLKDMGTPDRLDQVAGDFVSGKVAAKNLEFKQKAIFLDRDGVLNKDLHLIHKPEDFHLYPFTTKAIKLINRSQYLAVLATNQSVVARNLTSIYGLKEIHKKMETELGAERAKLDDIFYCPHHPDKGFPEENIDFKIDCECRKPKPGMLLQAAEKFNIDLSASYMIGDSERDIQAGMAAGATTIGVMTGNGLKSSGTRPDYFFKDLQESVEFIINDPLKNVAALIEDGVNFFKKGYIIAIGGNTGSGKTTLATYVRKYFEAQGYSILPIHLDDWIKEKAERKESDNVFDRFRMDQMQEDLEEVFMGKRVTVNAYRRHTSQKEQQVSYQYKGEDLVILDGIVAPALEKLESRIGMQVFLQLSEEKLKEKLFDLYRWKGQNENEIESLYQARKADEYDIIQSYAKNADILINSVHDNH